MCVCVVSECVFVIRERERERESEVKKRFFFLLFLDFSFLSPTRARFRNPRRRSLVYASF